MSFACVALQLLLYGALRCICGFDTACDLQLLSTRHTISSRQTCRHQLCCRTRTIDARKQKEINAYSTRYTQPSRHDDTLSGVRQRTNQRHDHDHLASLVGRTDNQPHLLSLPHLMSRSMMPLYMQDMTCIFIMVCHVRALRVVLRSLRYHERPDVSKLPWFCRYTYIYYTGVRVVCLQWSGESV